MFVCLLAVAGLVVPAQQPAAAAAPNTCPGQSSHTTNAGSFVRTHHPLILVHGFSGDSDSMWDVEKALTKRMPKTFDFRYFDYRQHSTDWAARPAIAACLADYINEVSNNFRASGGDGKVFLVAHSMGGLAIRFATDPSTVAHPVPESEIGGIVTIDTPHKGSPFGNSWLGTMIQWGNEHLGRKLAYDRTSDAVRCLAVHSNSGGPDLPSGCATPPYLPAGTHLAMISGTNTIERTLFGVHLYDIGLNSDGIVSVDSSTGYLDSGPDGQKPPRTVGSLLPTGCTMTTDKTMSLIRAAVRGKNLPVAIISAELKALDELRSDNALFDAIDSGRLTPNLEVLLGTTYLFSPCGHSAMLHNDDAMNHAADALRRDLASLDQATAQHPVGPTDITFDGIGPVKLGMNGAQLTAQGYTAQAPNSFGCTYYTAPGKPMVKMDRGVAVRIDPDDASKYQTNPAGLKIGPSGNLDQIKRSFKGYRIRTFVDHNFGQGADGAVVDGPGGSIAFDLDESSYDITGMFAAAPGFANEYENMCR